MMTQRPRPLSLTAQSAWQDLLGLLKDDAAAALRGHPTLKTVNGRAYWYDRHRIGTDVRERYIGPDSDELRVRLAMSSAMKSDGDARRRERARLVTLMRGQGMMVPDLASGQLLAALARAGVFRLGGTLVGTFAFRHYEGVLGLHLGSDQVAQTNDIDLAQFERLSMALQREEEASLADAFHDLEFMPVPSLTGEHIWRWRQTHRNTLVEFLTPSFSEDEGVCPLPALGVSAQSLHFLNYLIAAPISVPLLYRQGSLIQIPRPERYAIHKLIVADRRRDGSDAAKARKDRAQAALLVEILSEEQPGALADAYADALERGPAWRTTIARTLQRLPDTRDTLTRLTTGT